MQGPHDCFGEIKNRIGNERKRHLIGLQCHDCNVQRECRRYADFLYRYKHRLREIAGHEVDVAPDKIDRMVNSVKT